MTKAKSQEVALREKTAASVARVWPHVKGMLPEIVPEKKFKIVVWRAITAMPKLMECTTSSLLGSIVQTAQLGLMPGGATHEASILPFRNSGGELIATLIPEYRGLMKLARNTKEVFVFHAMAVFDADVFECSYGLERDRLLHIPSEDEDPGPLRGAYTVARMSNGTAQFRWLPKREIERARSASKAPNSPAWKLFYPEMAEKTAIRRICRHLPQSSELAVALDLASSEDGPVPPRDLSDLVPPGAVEAEYEESKTETLTDRLEEQNKEEAGEDENPFLGMKTEGSDEH